jgi:imidazolonepropionase-like amidohydrolase
MARKGIYYVPTVYVMDMAVVAGEQGRIPAENFSKAKEMAGYHSEAVKHAYQQGVKIVIGSDAVFSKRNAIKEFSALNRHINDSWYVLRAGTLTAAQMIDQAGSLGSLAPGKYADIIATPANPVEDLAALEAVNFVMKGGKVVYRDLETLY